MLQAAGWQVETGLSRNLPAAPQQGAILQALRGLAVAGGFDPEQTVRDALPFQYVFKCRPTLPKQDLAAPTPQQTAPDAMSPGSRAENAAPRPSAPLSRSAAGGPSRVAPKVPPVHLHQIAYSPATLASLEAGYHVLNNLTNERPDWHEYWPMRRFLINERLDDDALYGFFSPKFGAKTLLTHAQVMAFVQAQAPKADIVLFSPQPDMGAFYLNVFEQAETFDPGLSETYSAFLAQIGRPVTLGDLLMDSRQVVFSNYFVARPQFWREWLALNEPLFALCEGLDTPLRQALCKPTTYYDGVVQRAVQRKVFLVERAASLLLATQPHWRSVAYNPFGMGWSSSRLRNHPTDAVISDALRPGFPRSKPTPNTWGLS